MIYGLNFNGTEIPLAIKRKFKARVRINPRVIGKTPAIYATLKGVAQSPEEKAAMLIQATNETRRLHVETRKTGEADWYGIYVYYA